ncbi:unnamed protein product [Enterobius vermicularis]|uniref:UPF0160 protein MYG1, mitochondrial n=1 Tax=Enterobius vermicularis TaxID=51028 RepID=A0A0N4VBS6_ENTVE|nr:unnamed protein product [Enterobius vermicularis]
MGSIGTHNGTFHCDEVLACFLLKKLPEFSCYEVLRTRDSKQLDECNVVVDVGGVYDHSKMRYDHHQKDFNCTMKSLGVLNYDTKLSSAGLVYAHYGKSVIARLLNLKNDDPKVACLFEKLYETFVESVDAIDNGIPQYDGIPRYRLCGTLSGRVRHLNPMWNEGDVNVDQRFREAMKMVGNEFENAVNYLFRSWLPAKDIVAEAIKERFKVDESGKIVLLQNGGVPWKEHLFRLEKELKVDPLCCVFYVVFSDQSSGTWRVQAVPVSENSLFVNRLPLPEDWRGLRDQELSEVSGIPGCIFVHVSGFIGGNQSSKGAIEMAKKALKRAA